MTNTELRDDALKTLKKYLKECTENRAYAVAIREVLESHGRIDPQTKGILWKLYEHLTREFDESKNLARYYGEEVDKFEDLLREELIAEVEEEERERPF